LAHGSPPVHPWFGLETRIDNGVGRGRGRHKGKRRGSADIHCIVGPQKGFSASPKLVFGRTANQNLFGTLSPPIHHGLQSTHRSPPLNITLLPQVCPGHSRAHQTTPDCTRPNPMLLRPGRQQLLVSNAYASSSFDLSLSSPSFCPSFCASSFSALPQSY